MTSTLYAYLTVVLNTSQEFQFNIIMVQLPLHSAELEVELKIFMNINDIFIFFISHLIHP